MNDDAFPYMTLEFHVPQVRSHVHMMIQEQIGELEKQITATIEAALVVKSNRITAMVDTALGESLSRLVQNTVTQMAQDYMNTHEVYTKIEAKVKAAINELLSVS